MRRKFDIGITRYVFLVALLMAMVDVSQGVEKQSPAVVVPADHASRMMQGLELFRKQVGPLLKDQCLKCHGGEKVKSGFDLVTREGLLKGGDEGAAIVLWNAGVSKLMKLIRHEEDPHMPAKADKLSDQQITAIAAWIDNGAPYDKPLMEKVVGQKPKEISDEDRKFWSFQPVRAVAPPRVKDRKWGRTPIDRFILAKLEEKRIRPNPSVERRSLIRRAHLDLIGLPPLPEEVEAFVTDKSPDAWEKLLDKLLASPHYGERWARHWLDAVRFAESHGFEQDYDRPHAYWYRDFVIRALNDDMPYDQFVKWQLAGDEFAPNDPWAMAATGFLGACVFPTQLTEAEFESARYEELDDMAKTTGVAMLGLTIGCARCHDHKYDPIPTKDYYRFISTFTTTIRSEIELDFDPEKYKQAKAKWDAEHAPLAAALERFEREQLPARLEAWLPTAPASVPPKTANEAELNKILKTPADQRTAEQKAKLLTWYHTTDPEWKKLNAAIENHGKQAPKRDKAMVTSEGFKPMKHHADERGFPHFYPKTFFLRRGDVHQKGEEVSQGFLQVLSHAEEKRWQEPPPAGSRTSHRRRALANWITDAKDGAGDLLARVAVNRLWHHHFGRGIVATPNDFGAQGEKPTHPELLDWLANELKRNGWRLKPIHKLIMTSAVYMQTNDVDGTRAKLDDTNKFLWHWPRRRLEGESIRDSMLAVSGQLDTRMFGSGTLDQGMKRRSIYFFQKRSQLIPLMQLFDAPEPTVSIGNRVSTTIAPQALALMNNSHIRNYARAFATRLKVDMEKSPAEAVIRGYSFALGRVPDKTELADSVTFIQQQTDAYRVENKPNPQEMALTDFCQALMSLNEFVYVE